MCHGSTVKPSKLSTAALGREELSEASCVVVSSSVSCRAVLARRGVCTPKPVPGGERKRLAYVAKKLASGSKGTRTSWAADGALEGFDPDTWRDPR